MGVFVFAQQDIYLQYVNKLVNYNFELNDKETKRAPFEEKVIKAKIQKTLTKTIKIHLLSIFDKKAYLKIDEYLGDQLIKKWKKWVKVGDKIYKCRVSKITFNTVIIKCPRKTLVKTINQKIPGFKEIK
jgi:hypothetical protein